MPHALNGCRLKLERAVAHTESLNKAIQRFRETYAGELIRDEDAETGEDVWWIDGVHVDPPPKWSPLLGDIFHNLHSSLDHLAWQLAVRENGGCELPAGERITFPIFKNKSRFWRRRPDGKWTGLSGANTLLRFPEDARALVVAVQPYNDGNRAPNHPLWALHQLSNEDKHKTLHVVRSAMVDSRLEIEELEDARIEHFTPIQGPVKGKTEIGRILVHMGPNGEVKLKPAFAIAEAFGAGTPVVEGRYIEDVLNELLKGVIDVFRLHFAPYFKVDDWEEWRLTPGDPRNKDPL